MVPFLAHPVYSYERLTEVLEIIVHALLDG